MRILLDECLPKDLAREFTGHDVTTVPQAGGTMRRGSGSIYQLEIEIDFGAAVDAAAGGIVMAGGGDVRAAGLTGALGESHDL